jgi:indoleamine 2,3-dioxygenase
VRGYVAARANDSDLRDAYNLSVQELGRFRALHLEYAARYIYRQQQKSAANPVAIGTGGTPFMEYLEEHRQTTLQHLL